MSKFSVHRNLIAVHFERAHMNDPILPFRIINVDTKEAKEFEIKDNLEKCCLSHWSPSGKYLGILSQHLKIYDQNREIANTSKANLSYLERDIQTGFPPIPKIKDQFPFKWGVPQKNFAKLCNYYNIADFSWSPDEKSIALIATHGVLQESSLYIWSGWDDEPTQTFDFVAFGVTKCDWSQNGKYILGIHSEGRGVFIFDVETRMVVNYLDHIYSVGTCCNKKSVCKYVKEVTFSHNSEKVLCNFGSEIIVFDVKTSEKQFISFSDKYCEVSKKFLKVTWSGNDDKIACVAEVTERTGYGPKQIRAIKVFDLQNNKEIQVKIYGCENQLENSNHRNELVENATDCGWIEKDDKEYVIVGAKESQCYWGINQVVSSGLGCIDLNKPNRIILLNDL
jgi:WD40 repeat protein